MPRAGLSTAAVVERAARLIDDQGPGALSLAALAESLGVRAPSLYKHVDGMPGLERALMIRAKEDLALALGQAAVGRSRDDAIAGVSAAYRTWALEHPGQYPLTIRAPAPGDAADEAASSAVVDIVFSVLAGYDLHESDAVDATRFLRSALHGFVALETGGAFALPVDTERSFTRLVGSVTTALSEWSRAWSRP
ncbi:TetR/AcrR family transcriptional regulator [Arthrobacter agilis]|uniref:TetR/AcrR family transcriptional regulator n=1 Tax=Arthrobacter agilis TaxID=37921 RepID=UPI00277F5966|nr:TetR-like C-terminal domain-containing protein [Arthrobacter agilis]MDQ0736496.1 AcrR family transcriptional regulator [Arthrobacter agilis]